MSAEGFKLTKRNGKLDPEMLLPNMRNPEGRHEPKIESGPEEIPGAMAKVLNEAVEGVAQAGMDGHKIIGQLEGPLADSGRRREIEYWIEVIEILRGILAEGGLDESLEKKVRDSITFAIDQQRALEKSAQTFVRPGSPSASPDTSLEASFETPRKASSEIKPAEIERLEKRMDDDEKKKSFLPKPKTGLARIAHGVLNWVEGISDWFTL